MYNAIQLLTKHYRKIQLHCTRIIPGRLVNDGNTRLSTNSPTYATTTRGPGPVSTTVKSSVVGRSNNTIFIAVGIGGGIAMIIVTIVMCVFASLSIRRKTRLNSITKSKLSASEQHHSSNFDHELDILEPLVLETKAQEQEVVELEAENETEEDKSGLSSVKPS